MRWMIAVLWAGSLLTIGCDGSGVGGDGGPFGPIDLGSPAPDLAPLAGADAVVTAFDRKPVYFTGSDNQRTVDASVSFPTAGVYRSIKVHVQLDCPANGCDPWDR